MMSEHLHRMRSNEEEVQPKKKNQRGKRSAKGMKKQSSKKNARPKSIVVAPNTNMSKSQKQKPPVNPVITFGPPTTLRDNNGSLVGATFKNRIPLGQLNRLAGVAKQKGSSLAVHCKRRETDAVHIGAWTTRGGWSHGNVFSTNETLTDEGQDLMQEFAPLGNLISDVLVSKRAGICAAEVVELGEAIPEQYRAFGLFSLCVLNLKTHGTAMHVDSGDKKYCVVVPFGEFTEGAIGFSQLNRALAVQPGDFAIINSQQLYHSCLPFQGFRGSFIFTNKQGMDNAQYYEKGREPAFWASRKERCLSGNPYE